MQKGPKMKLFKFKMSDASCWLRDFYKKHNPKLSDDQLDDQLKRARKSIRIKECNLKNLSIELKFLESEKRRRSK
ncbi:hypothetical protein COB55_03155 [Candidatus Wolfebacteria bacterium]|nr:MAG: hypothetical protein COB55_03155 [Candidatus Wolfebacteria bacterium]